MPRYTLLLGLEDPTVKYIRSLQLMPVATVLMEMFVWWEAPISMRVEWRCASVTSGEQCVITTGTALMLLLSASSWDMRLLEVSICLYIVFILQVYVYNAYTQVEEHTSMPTLVLAVDQYF